MPNASKAATSTPYIPDITLDRSSPVPLYFQISEPIAELINTGALPADTRLEDELSMAARLHVSRPTARQALQRLVDRGLLTRRRGVVSGDRGRRDAAGPGARLGVRRASEQPSIARLRVECLRATLRC